MAQRWHAIMRSDPSDDSTAVLVGIWPHREEDGNGGLPRWFFEQEDFRWAESSSLLGLSGWQSYEARFDSIQFWRQEDRTWKLEWAPEVGPNPVWQSVKSADWDPLEPGGWQVVFDSLNDWCRRTF